MERVLKLRVIEQKEDKSKHEYASDDCQLLLKMYDDFYPKSDLIFRGLDILSREMNKLLDLAVSSGRQGMVV